MLKMKQNNTTKSKNNFQSRKKFARTFKRIAKSNGNFTEKEKIL